MISGLGGRERVRLKRGLLPTKCSLGNDAIAVHEGEAIHPVALGEVQDGDVALGHGVAEHRVHAIVHPCDRKRLRCVAYDDHIPRAVGSVHHVGRRPRAGRLEMGGAMRGGRQPADHGILAGHHIVHTAVCRKKVGRRQQSQDAGVAPVD
jgi:hypothetical protein